MFLLLTLDIFLLHISVSIVDFEQVNVAGIILDLSFGNDDVELNDFLWHIINILY